MSGAESSARDLPRNRASYNYPTGRTWRVAAAFLVAGAGGHRAAVHAVVFSPDGRHAVSDDAGGDVYLWTMPDR